MDAAPYPPAQATPAPAASPPRRRRWWRIVRNTLIGLVVALFLAWLVLYITKGRFLKGPFERIVSSATSRQVKVAGDFQLYFDPITIHFRADGMTISNPAYTSRPNLFEAKRLDSRIAPLSLLFGKRHFYTLDLTDSAVDLEWNAAHTHNSWTFSEKKGGKPLAFPRIDVATVAGTTLRYVDPRMRLRTDLAFQTITSTNAQIGKSVRFSGSGQVRNTPFTLVGALLSPDATVARGQNKLTMTADAAHNHITVAGTLPSLADIENVPLTVSSRGRNLAELLDIIGVAVPRSRTYHVNALLTQSGTTYAFTKLTGRFGDSDLAGAFTVENVEPRLHIGATLTTRKLDIIDAAPFIGYNPDIVATQGAVAAAASTGAAPARILPNAAIPVETFKNFNADLHYKIGVVRSKNVPVSNIDLTLSLKDSLLKLSPLTFVMARGNVAADITFDARRRPAHDTYDIRLSPTPMGRLLAGYGVIESGTTGVVKGRIALTGDGDTLHDSLASSHGRIAFVMPGGTFSARNVQLSELDIGTFAQKLFQGKLKEPVKINCGLIGFSVRGGVAAADPILIDTEKNVIAGRGGFSFRDEHLDLVFRADGKRISLFSAQSPVGLVGSFAKPGINVVTPQLLERAGAAAGLSLVATPVAGLLAFVDVGDAKAAQCGPILAAAPASAQRTTKGQPRDDVGHGTTATAEKDKSGKAPRKKFLGIF
ncbi:AsmA family protein [Sphingomonas sp. CARO-RG-8B-R24-01]|uniref:AsmA family protein n=1 Tax=Sphingomonas sp. CARO-RG-8B-R24-01 TaxID=2914831 RepID=UPI001F565CE6|nr:AsmA family protein [Sphingomonas sp. CARO-RG-8B-R24-01]